MLLLFVHRAYGVLALARPTKVDMTGQIFRLIVRIFCATCGHVKILLYWRFHCGSLGAVTKVRWSAVWLWPSLAMVMSPPIAVTR
jgi:hypothetical protein